MSVRAVLRFVSAMVLAFGSVPAAAQDAGEEGPAAVEDSEAARLGDVEQQAADTQRADEAESSGALELETTTSRRTLVDLGFGPRRRVEARSNRIGLPLVTRVDRVLLRGQLQLGFAPDLVPKEVQSLDIELNGERLARLERRELLDGETMRIVELDERLLSGKDVIVFALNRVDDCATLRPGTWRFVDRGFLETAGTPLPLPNDLGLLPAPLLDRGFERQPKLAVVLPARSASLLHAAAIAVGGLVTQIDAQPRLEVLEALPDNHGILLVPDQSTARRFGVPFYGLPSAEMVTHPNNPFAKLLVISGEGPDALMTAARALFVGEAPAGAVAHFDEVPPSDPPAAPSRWFDASRPITVGQIVEDGLVHRGAQPGTLRVAFRVSPILFGWPEPTFIVRLRHRRQASNDAPPLRVDIEFNGSFIDTLIVHGTEGEQSAARLTVPRQLLRGYNELVVHIRSDVGGCEEVDDPDASFEILGSTSIHLEDFVPRVDLPDVERFAFDGYPFSLRGRLSETAAILSDNPTAAETATFLSVIAQIAGITGDPPTDLKVLTTSRVPAGFDRDLLLVGRFETHPVLRAWQRRSPIAQRGDRLYPQRPSTARLWRRVIAGDFDFKAVDRARAATSGAESVAALAGFASPVRHGRSVIALTASSDEAMPSIGQFTGFAEARRRGGDLMLIAMRGAEEGQTEASIVLSRHALGDTRSVGELGPWTRLLWTASRNWLALFPTILLGVVLVRASLWSALDRRHRFRVKGAHS